MEREGGHDAHGHQRRYGAPGERLRAPERVALLQVPRAVDLGLQGLAPGDQPSDAAAAGKGLSVLDIGTGTGLFAEALLARGVQVTGIDPNQDLLDMAGRLVPGAAFLAGTAETLPFGNGSFDLVWMSHVLHETDDPQAALAEAARVARRRVVVIEWPYLDEERGPPLAHRLEPARIEALGRQAGFARIEMVPLGHMLLYRMDL